MTDERDGQTYKTVKIGTQTWMAENLNYAYTSVPYKYKGTNDVYTSDSTSWCNNNDASNCTKYGRLYTWAAAMDSTRTWSFNGRGCGYGKTCSPTYPVRGICPAGWHLPTRAEFETLFTSVGGKSSAGTMLKSTSGWTWNGSDTYSFSALPSGSRFSYGVFSNEVAYFWSSTEFHSDDAYFMCMNYYDYDHPELHSSDKYNGFSVRCLKD